MEPPSFPAGGPQVLRANPGSDTSLILPLPSGTPPFQFEWSRAGAKLGERFTSSHNAGGVRLSISAARTGDSGVYTLQASNAAGKDTTRVHLEVSPDEMPTGDDPPTFLRRLQDLTVKVGTRTRFLVEIVSSTESRVTWYRNERRLMEAERIALVRDGNFWCADISAVSVDDAGRWTCTAENIGGRASCSAHLNVLVPKAYKRPEFVEELRALLTEQGTVSLECKVVGVPTPVLRWFKDSREIKAGDVFALTANAEDPTSLGTYTCEAVNCMGRAYSSSKVQVVGRSSREGSRPSSGGVLLEPPPIFTKELEDQFVRICDRLTLSCKIVVPPWPRTVVWYNKDGKVESNEKYHILEDGVGGYFIEIQTCEFPDEGEWKCVATSAGGRVGISTCYVSMDIPKNYRKPRFMENLQAVLTEEGLVSFECKVVGFPTPVLSWFKDGQELKPGDVYQLTGTNSLGSYCCIARNFMGQASSSAELTVEDIQNQLNEEEKLQLFSKNQAPKYLQGLKSVEAKIDEPFRFMIKVAIPPEPAVLWYRDEQPVDESSRCHLGNEERGSFFLDIQNLEFMDQAEWKCVAMNDYGQSVTSCFLKLIIPRHFKKPRFLENLQAILSDEGAVNLECKVIGVPQPVLKWYKDGEELKPGDIHRIISGQDGTCCLGTYTCEAQNCMGIAASSASLLGFEDSLKAKNKKKTDEQTLQRNLSLSTIHEERTSQMYDTPVGDITLDDKGEISFSFDGKEVSVSLYETPDLTEEEALQIVEMYADQLSENVTEHNVVELPPLRFVKETSTSGNLLMEAIIIDVSPEYFTSPEEDLRTEADIEDISIADENGPPQLSLDQDVSGENYLEKTMALLSEERADISKKIERKKSDSQRSVDDYFSLSRDRSSSGDKKDDDTQVLSESDLQSFASAHSTEKPKSKSSKPSLEDGQESSDFTKTVLLKEDVKVQLHENVKSKKERRGSRGSRRSTSSEKSPLVIRKEVLEIDTNIDEQKKILAENIKMEMMSISSSLTKVMNTIQILERDIILKSELMSVAATASRSLEIINSLITPLSEIHSITDTITETENESSEIICSLLNRLPESLGMLEQSLTIVEKCIDYESDNKTLVKKTCLSLIERCGDTLQELITGINTIAYKEYTFINDICIANIKTSSQNILKTLKSSAEASKRDKMLNKTVEDKNTNVSLESQHLNHTQKVLYSLKSSLKSVLSIIEGSDAMNKSIGQIKNVEIILDEISTPIQELQNSLEQIETLSVAEADSNLPRYNTEIIESVINSILKLRTAFEQLSTDKENKMNEVLLDIKENIYSISSQLELFEEKSGKFNILHNENKLEVLQTMAQILISLENSLPILDTIPNLKTNMSDFHKNLTKVLENVIEGNDSIKYFTLLEICNAISRINTSLNNMESRQVLSLAIINNTLKIIKKSVLETIFENSLNKSVLQNINDLLLDIEETINQVEESTLNVESEKVEDLSMKIYEKNNIVTVLEQVQKTIASISKVVSFENVENLTIAQVFENIHPILTDIQFCVASLNVNTTEHSEKVADISISSFTEAIANPLCELHQNISVLNEVICEIANNYEITQFTAFADPLIELQTTLQILQAEVISQYEEVVQCPVILGSIANSVDNLQSCIVKIQEHDILEVADDMSTLDDISGIKTTADVLLPTDQYMISSIENIKIEEFPVIQPIASQAFSDQILQALNKHIVSLLSSDVAKNINLLSDDTENLPIKSLILQLQLINSDTERLLHPISIEGNEFLSLNPSKLVSLVQPLEHLQECLATATAKNVTVYENVEEINQTQLFTENLLNLKTEVDAFLNILTSAVEAVDLAIDKAAKRVALRQLPEKLDILLNDYHDLVLDKTLKMELSNLHTDILNASYTTLSDNINVEGVHDIIEKVNKSILKVQDEGFNCSAESLNAISHEYKLVNALSEMEQCLAIIEQSDFSEEFAFLTSESNNKLSEIASDTKVDPLIQLDQITNTIVNAIDNQPIKDSENDIKLTKEFCDTFTKEITLLRYIIKNRPSPKSIIKSIQIFYALNRSLNDFKSRYHYTLSDEYNESLKANLCDMENCLKSIKTILIQIIHSQSQILFDIPQTKINDGENYLKTLLRSEKDILLHTTCSVILNTINSLKPFNDNLEYKIINEISTYERNIPQQDDADSNIDYDYLPSVLTVQANSSLENPLKDITEKLVNVIKKYDNIQNIIGIGRKIIFIQCISDCIEILKQSTENINLMENNEKSAPNLMNIDTLLLEILEPLDCFNTQIINIRNKTILSLEKDIDSTDLKVLESYVNVIRNVKENIEHCISNNDLALDSNDVSIVLELSNKIHLILNNLKTLESTKIFDTIKVVVNPIEEIEKNLHLIISYNKNLIDKNSQSNKEKAEALLQQMEQHIEIIEIVEEVSAVIRLVDLKETASIVRELRDNITRSDNATDSGMEENNKTETTGQIPLTEKLQRALISLHSQALDSAQQDIVNVKEDIRQQIINAVSDLQNNLTQLTNISSQNTSKNVNIDPTDILQEEDETIIKINSDEQSRDILTHDEIKCELIGPNQIKENTGDTAEHLLKLPEINDNSKNLVPESKVTHESNVKDLQVEEKYDNKIDLLSSEVSEKLKIDNFLGYIQEYLHQDITEITKQFASCLNYEAVKITQELSQQLCQDSDLNNCLSLATTCLVMSDEQSKLLSNLHKNLEDIFTCEPVREMGEVVVEEKLLQFKNVAKNLCEAIETLNISSINDIKADKIEVLSINSPDIIEPKIEEVENILSQNEILTCNNAVQESSNVSDILSDNEVLLTRKDSKPEDLIFDKNVTEYSSSADANRKEDLRIKEEKLIHYISEYISEEVTELLKQTSIFNTEHLEKSHQIANQLFTLSTVTNFDETSDCNLLKEKLELTIQLNESITVIYNEIFDETKKLPILFEKDKLKKIKNVLKNVADTLQTYITFEQHIPIEQVIELDENKQVTQVEPIHTIIQTVDDVNESIVIADLVYKVEEKKILSNINKEDEEVETQTRQMSESDVIDKSENSLLNESEYLMLSTDHESEKKSIQKLEKLLQEVNDNIDLSSLNIENSEIIQNNLDEVQSIVIKLKCDFDGTANDALNETLEDLECNVRSVQLQINEQSPPVLLKEECSNLQVIVACLNSIEDVNKTGLVSTINTIINNCSEDADRTIQLLNEACCLDTNIKLDNIISCLNNVKGVMKSLRTSFVGDSETLILKGIDIIYNLDQVEDKIFSLEKDMNKIQDIDDNIKDNIITAMHSVYGSISNMRGAMSSIQKRYMYENYGKPTQNFLKSIKNIADISQFNVDNKPSWKKCSKYFRKVLNHFEDIKFYINFDRTARIPNDAAFTKIILREIIAVLDEVQKLHDINSDVKKTINDLSNYVNNKYLEIEGRTTLEVKEKIPIFIDLSVKILEATEFVKIQLQGSQNDVLISKFIETGDKEENKLTDHSTAIEHYEEQTCHLSEEGTELISVDEKKELVKVSIEQNATKKAAEMESFAVVQTLLHQQDYVTDNEELGTDEKQIYAKEVEIAEMPSEEVKQGDNYIFVEKDVQLLENIRLTSSDNESVDDKNVKSEETQLTPIKDFSNVTIMENNNIDQQDILTRQEITEIQQVSERSAHTDNSEVLLTKTEDNVKSEVDTTMNMQEVYTSDNIKRDDQIKENQQSDILKQITLDSNTTELAEHQLTPSTTITKNQKDLSTNNKELSDIEDHHHATDTSIERNLKIEENKIISEKQTVNDKQIENKDNTNENNQPLGLPDISAHSEETISGSIINEKKSKETALMTTKEETSLLEEEKNIQDTKKDNVMDPKDYCQNTKRVSENLNQQEVSFNENTECVSAPVILEEIAPLKKNEISLINEITVSDSVCTDNFNAGTSLVCVLKDTDVSFSNKVEESEEANKNLQIEEQVIQKELSAKTHTQNEDFTLMKDRSVTVKDENGEKITNDIKKNMEEEEYIGHSDSMHKGDNLLLQANINKLTSDELKLLSITDKIEANEKSVEQNKELMFVKEEPQINLQSDLNNKDIEDTNSYLSHERSALNNNKENDELNTNNDMRINQLEKSEQSCKIEDDFTTSTIVKEVFTNEDTMSEISAKSSKKDYQESMIIKEDIIDKENESSTDTEKQKEDESVKCDQLESVDKGKQKSGMNMQSHLVDKGAIEVNLEYEQIIDVKAVNDNVKAPSMISEESKSDKISDTDKHQIKEQERFDSIEAHFPETIKLEKECLETDHKARVVKILEQECRNDDRESITLKKDILLKDDERLISKEKLEESLKCREPESDNQIVFSDLKEKDIQIPLNVQSDLEHKEVIEVKSENKEVIDAKSFKVVKKASLTKSAENELLEITENTDIYEIEKQQQSDNKEAKYAEDAKENKEHSESEHKALVTEILEKDYQNGEQESITVKIDVINKDVGSSISKEKLEKSLKCNQVEADNQIVLSQSIETDIQLPLNVQSDLENKEAKEVKSEKIQVIDAKSYKDSKEASLTKSEENEIFNISESTDIREIEQQQQSHNKEAEYTEDARENKELSDSEHKVMATDMLEKDYKNGDQESISFKKDFINEDDESSISKEKLEKALKYNEPEADNQIVFREPIEKDIQIPLNVQSGPEDKKVIEVKPDNKEVIEVKPDYKEVVEDKSYKGIKETSLTKSAENELFNIPESTDIHQISQQQQSDNKEAEYTEDGRENKVYSESEHKVLVTEVLEKDVEKNITLTRDVMNKDDEKSINKQKQEDSKKYDKTEKGDQILFSDSLEKDKQDLDVNVQSGLENTEIKDSISFDKNAMVQQTIKKELVNNKDNEDTNVYQIKNYEHIDKKEIDDLNKNNENSICKKIQEESVNQAMLKEKDGPCKLIQSDLDSKETGNTKYYSADEKASENKNKDNESVNIFKGTDLSQMKEQEKSDKKEENVIADTKVKMENTESELNITTTKITEKQSGIEDLDSVISNGNDENIYSENSICKKTLKETVEPKNIESDEQILLSESINKEELDPQRIVQSNLENIEKQEVKSYPDDKNATTKTMEEIEIIKKNMSAEITEKQEESTNNIDENNLNTLENKESKQFATNNVINELSKESCKTDLLENIILYQDTISKNEDNKNHKGSSESIRYDSGKIEIEEVFTDNKKLSVSNSDEIEEVGFVKDMHTKQLKETDNSNNKALPYVIDTLQETKCLESEKTPVLIEENSTHIDIKEKNVETNSNIVETMELKAEVKNQDARETLDGDNKKYKENITTNDISKSVKTSTSDNNYVDNNDLLDKSINGQEILTTESNLQIVNEPKNIIEEDKSKSLEKNKDENNIDKKTNEVNNKQQVKNKKNGKKKQKSDKKKIFEEQKENVAEKRNIEIDSLMQEKDFLQKGEDKKLFEKQPIQVEIDDKQRNIINTDVDNFSKEEYKSRSTEYKVITTEGTKSGEMCIPYTTDIEEYIAKTEQKECREYEFESTDETYKSMESGGAKYRPKESPKFIDHNKTDYTLQFPRPPNYTSKSYDNEELIGSELNLLNRAPIYKAQTLVHNYQSRSFSPRFEQNDQNSHNYGERAFARSRSKALSESRSTTSEMRTSRDHKRKPVFSTFLTDRTAVESSRVKLTCSILSSSDPTIQWYKNGILLEDKQKFRSKFIDGLITLEVLNAIPNDSGEYSCTVENEYGSITSSANLKVYPSFEASPIPPTFTRSIRDVYHSLENELVLECRIRGQPLPSITWYKDDKPITLCERYQAHYLADGVCRLTVSSPSKEDSGKYTCHAESSIWSDQIYHNVQFTEKESCVKPNIFTLDKVRLNHQVLESRKPHFTNVISDYKVVRGGTIGLQVEIKGSPTRVEWLREGCSVTDTYRNAQTFVDHGIYTLALSDVTEKESGLYTCRAWSSHGNVDMNASIIVVQPNQIDGKPAVIISRPTKDVLISIGEDINISFRVQGEPKAKVIFMKGLRDITHSQRVCKMTSDDYIKFTLKRSVISDAGTYCILARNAYGCDRAFVTVVIRQRASSENLVSDWTYPMDDLAISALDRNYKAVPDRIPSEPSVVDGGKNWVSLAWPKPDCQTRAPILAYKVESWLIGKEGGARWAELGITPRNSFDAFNLKQEAEYHFRVTPRNRYGWGESVQTTAPIGVGLTGDRPEFIEILPGQLKVLLGETATLCCTFNGKPTPEILWMKNGHEIEEDPNRVNITLNSHKACLNIQSVKTEDEGRYSCEASNIHGRSSTYARMTVITDRTIWEADAKLKRERSSGVEGEYPPQFTMRLRDRRVQATYPVRLTCQVIGGPVPLLTWFKNGEEVTDNSRHTMSQDEYFYTLEIAPTTLDDGGVYEAMARNSSGAISCHCSLVVDKGIRAYVAPEFCCGLEPLYQLKEGEELRISAVIEAYPSVGVCWYRDGVRLRPSRRAIMTLDRDGQIELALASVTARDAGVYTCTASNEVGRVSTSGKVEILGGESNIENVHAPPIFVSDESSRALYSNEPRFLRKPRSSEAREGDTVIIECEVIGDPKPEVYWLRDFLKPDYYRDANHFKRVGAGPEYRFEIPHAKFDYTGAYSVIAKNIHGEAKAIISLQILARDPNSGQDVHNIKYGRVEVIPRFEKDLTDLLCYDGDAVEFECRVSANPEPDIRWFHYSEVVPECSDFESSYDRGTARLKIKQVTAEDEGTYRCQASNSLGKATSSACLVVYPPGEPNTLSQRLRRPPTLLSGASTPRSTPRTTPRTTPARSLSATPGPDSRRLCSPSREIAPKFYTYPFNRVAEEGDTVVFQCAVKGLPPPWATWDKDGIIITASSRITIKEKDEMFRILEIEQVNVEDVGLYRITLENDYGRAEASAMLEVISGKGKFHGTRSFSASPSRRTLNYRRRTPSYSRQD